MSKATDYDSTELDSMKLDNVGGTFLSTDDDDLETILTRAADASEYDGDTLNFKDENDVTIDEEKPRRAKEEPETAPLEVQEEVVTPQEALSEPVEEIKAEDDPWGLDDIEDAVSFSDEVVEPEPTVEEPAIDEVIVPDEVAEPVDIPEVEEHEEVSTVVEKTSTSTKKAKKEDVVEEKTPAKVTKSNINVPSEKDQIATVARTIRIIDSWRKLTGEEKSVTLQFITEGEMNTASDAVLVVKVMNADPLLGQTMKAMSEAWECEPVERAFYTMSLDTGLLHNLGEMVSVFSEADYDETLSNLNYSKAIVADISQLGDREMAYIKATESVLLAADSVNDD